jgi:Uncharacterized protein conserved in bacteria
MARYADELAAGAPLPDRTHISIDFSRIDALLDSVFLVDVEAGGEDYYFKYFGETMHILCGINLCGHHLSEIADPGMRQSFKASYDTAIAARAPVYVKGYYAWADTRIPIERLVIPITGEEGVITALCGVSVPTVAGDDIRHLVGKGPATLCGNDQILAG